MRARSSLSWTASLAALGLVAACNGAAPEDASAVGTLALPLRSTGSNGTEFGLAGSFDLVGPETITRTVAVGDPTFGDDLLTLNPRVGSYMLTLSGYQLFDLSAMPPVMVAATLLDSPIQAVDIMNNQTTNVLYRFSVPGTGTVVFARGTLNIDFSVTEGFPDGSACMADSVCESHVCVMNVCASPTCGDGVLNGDETSPDCGGSCGTCSVGGACNPPCPAGTSCVLDAAGVAQCEPIMGCSAATCPNGMCVDADGDGLAETCQVAGGCNPMDPTTCPAGQMCALLADGTYGCL